MNIATTREALFKPSRPTAETKAEITNRTARAMIDAEAERREINTAKLRQARLEKEALMAAEPEPVKARRVKAAGPRRSRSAR